MAIPFIVFLLVYIIAAAFVMLFAAFGLYHAIRYALDTQISIVVTTFFVCVLLVLLIGSVVLIFQVEWDQSFTFSIFS